MAILDGRGSAVEKMSDVIADPGPGRLGGAPGHLGHNRV